MKNTTFKPMDFFLLRTPLMPIDTFIELFNNESLSEKEIENHLITFCNKPIIREALMISSYSLLKSIDSINKYEPKSKKRRQIIDGAIKYISRMCTRSTPFGLMAGVETGFWGDTNCIEIETVDTFTKRTRPDMEWLFGIIENIESMPFVVNQLNVFKNPSCVIQGDRVELPYTTNYNNTSDKKLKNASVKYSPAVDFVLSNTQSPIKFSELEALILSNYSDSDKNTISNFLHTLFKNQILISDLRPPLTIESPFDYLLDKISNIKGLDDLYKNLLEIQTLIKNYDSEELGFGSNVLSSLLSKMKKLKDVKNPLQVDLLLNKNSASLNNEIAQEVSKTAECLWKLSNKMLPKHFNSYRIDFIEKYGMNREVPLLELLDSDKGLGAPNGYQFPPSKRLSKEITSEDSYDFSQFLMNKYSNILMNGNDEIEITDEILDSFFGSSLDYSRMPLSMELYTVIHSKSNKDLNTGNYDIFLGSNPISNGAGKTFGRFVDILDDFTVEKIKNIHQKEQLLIPDVVFAEIVYCPASGRSANVAIAPNIRDYELALSTTSSKSASNTIDLNDLVVGVDNVSFYIRSKSLNKYMLFTAGNMLNKMNTPNIYRFLKEVSMYSFTQVQPFNWKSLKSSVYLPRVRYRKSILSPAEWKLYPKELLINSKASHEECLTLLSSWIKKWRVAKFVYLTSRDNKILLDLNNTLHLNLLVTELRKTKEDYIRLVESNFHENGFLKNSNNETYFSEVVVPLIKTEITEDSNSNLSKLANTQKIYRPKTTFISDTVEWSDRVKLPGSDWLYVKLYGNSKRENELICNYILPLFDEVLKANLAKKMFFIRYIDAEKHLRLRFFGVPNTLISKLIPLISNWAENLVNKGLLSHMSIDTYEREVERYGGLDTLNICEDIFLYDSMISAKLLYLDRSYMIPFDFEILCVLSIIFILDKLGWNFEQQLNWIDSIVNYKEYKQEFRTYRPTLLKVCDSDNDWENLKSFENGETILKTLLMGSDILPKFAIITDSELKKNKLYNNVKGIVSSIIHMHCNRMLGTDRTLEKKIMTLTRHTLYNMRYKKSSSKRK